MSMGIEDIAFEFCNDGDNNSGKGCQKGDCVRYNLFKRRLTNYFVRKINKLETEDYGVNADKDYISREEVIKLIKGESRWTRE